MNLQRYDFLGKFNIEDKSQTIQTYTDCLYESVFYKINIRLLLFYYTFKKKKKKKKKDKFCN